MILFNVFLWTSMIIAALVAIIIVLDFNRQPKDIYWLAIVFIFSLSCDLLTQLIVRLDEEPSINPNIVGQFGYHTIAVILETVMFYALLKSLRIKSLMIFICIAHVVFSLINFGFLQKSSFTSFTNALHSIIILLYCILFYYKLLKDLPTQQLQSLPQFWIVSGFFFSFAGKLVIYTVIHFLLNYLKDNLLFIVIFHNLLSILGNAIVCYGVWLNYRTLRTPSRTSITS